MDNWYMLKLSCCRIFLCITWINVLLKSIFLVEAPLFRLLRLKTKKTEHIESSRDGVNDRYWLDPWNSELSSDSLWTSCLQNPTHNTHKSAKVEKKKVSLSFPLKLLKVLRILLKGQRGTALVLSCPKAYYLSDVWTLITINMNCGL